MKSKERGKLNEKRRRHSTILACYEKDKDNRREKLSNKIQKVNWSSMLSGNKGNKKGKWKKIDEEMVQTESNLFRENARLQN